MTLGTCQRLLFSCVTFAVVSLLLLDLLYCHVHKCLAEVTQLHVDRDLLDAIREVESG